MEFLGFLADGMDTGVLATNAEGSIEYANHTFRRVLGVPLHLPLVGTNLLRRLSGASRTDFGEALAKARLGPVQGKLEVMCEDDRTRTIRIALQAIDRKGRPTVLILAKDETDVIETTRALHETEASLRLLSGQLLQIQDEERRRMARDLHDITGQKLAVVIMSLAAMAKTHQKVEPAKEEAFTEVIGLVRQVEEEIRTLSYLLHPPMLDELGLAPALHWYAEGFTKRSNIKVDLSIPRSLPRLSRDREIALFRVVQESLTNVLRHSGSTEARIRAGADDKSLRIWVEDSGHGFLTARHNLPADKSVSGKVKFGVGILGMCERLQQLGGALDVRSTSHGVQVCAMVPIEIAKEAGAILEEATPEYERQAPQPVRQEKGLSRRILVAEDHEVVRRGIRSLLAAEADLEICGEAVDGAEAIEKACALAPDLVILDLTMPRVGGLLAARVIRERNSTVKILVFTNHSYNLVQSMLRNVGCEGYVHKSRASADLIRGIRAVLNGDKFFDSEIARVRSA